MLMAPEQRETTQMLDQSTEHDDAAAGKQRLAAYVLGFTPDWRAAPRPRRLVAASPDG